MEASPFVPDVLARDRWLCSPGGGQTGVAMHKPPMPVMIVQVALGGRPRECRPCCCYPPGGEQACLRRKLVESAAGVSLRASILLFVLFVVA